MKKIVTLILFLAVTAVYAQSFQFFYHGEQVSGTFDFIADRANDDNELALIVTNNSNEVDSIYLTKHVISEVDGSYNTFCIGACVDPSVTTSSTPLVLQPGESSTNVSFHLLYNPCGNEGTTTVKYVFTSGSYQDSVTVNYIYGTVGVEEAAVSVNSLTAYPNPATSSVTIAYDLSNLSSADTRVVITNLVGSKVAVRPIAGTSGKVSMDISNLDSGIYFYSIESAGKVVSTKKLIVR